MTGRGILLGGDIVQVLGQSSFGVTVGVVSEVKGDDIVVDHTEEFSGKRRAHKGVVKVKRQHVSLLSPESLADWPLIAEYSGALVS